MLIKRLFRKSSIHNFFCDCDLEFFQESVPQITQHISNRISKQKISIKLSRNLIKVTPTHGNSPEELLHHLANLQEAVSVYFTENFQSFCQNYLLVKLFMHNAVYCLQNKSIHPTYFWELVTEGFNRRNVIARFQGECSLNGIFLEPSNISGHVICTYLLFVVVLMLFVAG